MKSSGVIGSVSEAADPTATADDTTPDTGITRWNVYGPAAEPLVDGRLELIPSDGSIGHDQRVHAFRLPYS